MTWVVVRCFCEGTRAGARPAGSFLRLLGGPWSRAALREGLVLLCLVVKGQ